MAMNPQTSAVTRSVEDEYVLVEHSGCPNYPTAPSGPALPGPPCRAGVEDARVRHYAAAAAAAATAEREKDLPRALHQHHVAIAALKALSQDGISDVECPAQAWQGVGARQQRHAVRVEEINFTRSRAGAVTPPDKNLKGQQVRERNPLDIAFECLSLAKGREEAGDAAVATAEFYDLAVVSLEKFLRDPSLYSRRALAPDELGMLSGKADAARIGAARARHAPHLEAALGHELDDDASLAREEYAKAMLELDGALPQLTTPAAREELQALLAVVNRGLERVNA
eukprot:TRINITY_DN25850_c0_g1_i1.p1 TRINITY_DN25850_c0_g1~~TRINITY_DN25850_c0_g1_i1.p1  ORF type:complete len:284 (+),score=84.72 TRINITY_DN25850_c0_g1_i1:60-911(+)